MAPVIVFGPTGSVGSITAITAQQHGAKVVLGMRDTSKSIPGLSPDEEKQHGYTRVTADLTKPDTITAAVKESGAKRAFIYLAHAASDHMKGTIEALKSAGIEFVVFLSSYMIQGEPATVPQHEITPFLHAQVEVQLENIYGPKGYAAIRPGAFATNSYVWWGHGIKQGEVKMFGEKVKFDFTTPEDMGGVAGAVLADGPKNGQKIIYVFGPQFVSQEEGLTILSSQLNKEVKLKIVSADEGTETFQAGGIPPPIAAYLTKKLAEYTAHPENDPSKDTYEEGVQNVKAYTGRPGLSFKAWSAKHKGDFE